MQIRPFTLQTVSVSLHYSIKASTQRLLNVVVNSDESTAMKVKNDASDWILFDGNLIVTVKQTECENSEEGNIQEARSGWLYVSRTTRSLFPHFSVPTLPISTAKLDLLMTSCCWLLSSSGYNGHQSVQGVEFLRLRVGPSFQLTCTERIKVTDACYAILY